uniref:Uncharacterized protein n=1 Tax=Tetranychus urticae TaxID=32264 RepID=T1K7T9_TETUR
MLRSSLNAQSRSFDMATASSSTSINKIGYTQLPTTEDLNVNVASGGDGGGEGDDEDNINHCEAFVTLTVIFMMLPWEEEVLTKMPKSTTAIAPVVMTQSELHSLKRNTPGATKVILKEISKSTHNIGGKVVQ